MTKRIILALSIFSLMLGSLACFMQTAPSTPTHPPTKPATQAAQSAERVCTVNARALNVRECGGIDCSVIGWLEAGWIVKAELSGSRWIHITRGELSGFARADYLTCNSGE